MPAQDSVQHGVSMALEAHRRKLLDDRCLDAILQYYDAEGARDPFPVSEVLIRVGGLSEDAVRSLFAGPAPSPSSVQGEKFGDRLTLLDKVGEGGMGAVFRAYDKILKRGVAVKRLRVDHLDGKGAAKVLARFEREAHAMARVRHPACVQIFDAGLTPKGEPYLVMEFVAGKSLRGLIEESYGDAPAPGSDPLLAPLVPPSRARSATGPLDPHMVARLGASLAEALQACHDVGLVHRDVKPANILLDAQGNPRLTDFGVALDDKARTKLTVDRAMVGTLAYMAPEQALGERVDARCDIYALGVTLYEALCGQPPHDAGAALVLLRQVLSEEVAALHTLRRDVPRDLETIIHKCLAKAAGDRYATAQALALDLRRFLADEPVLAQPITGVQLLARRAWRARRWIGGAVAALMCAIAVLGIGRVRARERMRAEIESALAAAAIASDLDAAEARVLPLIAVAELEQAERGREALRLLRGRRRLREAEAAFARWRDGVGLERALRREAWLLREKIDPAQEFKASPDKQRLIAIQAEEEQARTNALASFLETERLVAQAAADGAEGVDALRVRILVERARDVEDKTPEIAAGLFKEADAIVGDPANAFGVDLGRPEVAVQCDPPLAKVTLSRYQFDRSEGLMVATRLDGANSTPVTLRGDEVGEYLLEVSAPGYLVARDLLQLSRGSKRSIRLSLVSEASLGPLAGLVVHIPAGEARWEADLEARESLDEFLITRDEVSYQQWMSFANTRRSDAQLVAFVPHDEAGSKTISNAELPFWPAVNVSPNNVNRYVVWFQSEIDLAGFPWRVSLQSRQQYGRAVRGELSWTFPWGNIEEPTFCRCLETLPLDDRNLVLFSPLLGRTRDESGFGVRSLAGMMSEVVGPGSDLTKALTIGGSYIAPIWAIAELVQRNGAMHPDGKTRSVTLRLAFSRAGELDQVVGDRNDARMFAAQAEQCVQRSDLIGAHELLTQALRADRDNLALWNDRANVRRMLGDYWGAVWDCSVALTKRPRNPALHINRGLAQLERGCAAEALADLDTAVELAPASADAFAARSLVKLEMDDVAGARRDAREAVRLDPTHRQAVQALRRVDEASRVGPR